MAKQANRMIIGGFVIFAVIILAASLIFIGSGKFFKETREYVLYFDESIKGLDVGSLVLFQGVQIGSVKKIVLKANMDKSRIERPVIIEVWPDRFQIQKNQKRQHPNQSLQELIDRGMRAVLTPQSMITGQLLIELDFFPETHANLRLYNDGYLEIPTIPSATERFAQTLQKLDLEGMKKNIQNTFTGIDRLVNSPEMKDSLHELKGALKDGRRLVKNLNTSIGIISESFDLTLRDSRKLVNNVDRQVAPLADNLNLTLEEFGILARDANTQLIKLGENLKGTLTALKGVMSEDAPLIVEMENTLHEISAAARSVRQLAYTLEQQPESLIQGKRLSPSNGP
jgi:paraquat-inducible protein B